MAERSLAELERDALVRITEAVLRTRGREEELVSARDSALRETGSRIAGLRSAAAVRLERAEGAARQTWSEAHRLESERFDVAIAELEAEQVAVTAQVEERSRTRVGEAERARHEAIWLAETVYEATSNQPHEKFDQHSKGIVGFGQELDRVESEALAWLAACRMRPAPEPTVEATGADEADRRAAEAAGTLPSKPELERAADAARASLAALRALWMPRLFHSGLPVVLVLLAALVAGGAMIWRDAGVIGPSTWIAAGGGAVLGVAVMIAIHLLVRRRVQRLHLHLREQTRYGRFAADRCATEAAELRDRQLAELAQRRDREVARANEVHGPLLEQIEQRRVRRLGEIGDRYPAQLLGARRERTETLAALEAKRDAALIEAKSRHDQELEEGERRHAEAVQVANNAFETGWRELVTRWRAEVDGAWSDLEHVRSTIALRFPEWSDPTSVAAWERFECASDFPPAIPFGRYAIDLESLEGGLPRHADLALPGPSRFEIPALLDFPEQASLLVRGSGAGLEAAVPLLQVVMFRLLTALPPAKVRFTIIDPVGLGQNFAGFMHLADDDGALVTDRIWTEDRHIDQRLLDLTEHMENVIQKYLRNEYETIGQYNVDAGEVAEPYRFLVIANLPVNFSEGASRRLMSVASSGPRCGVFTLVTADTRAAAPPGLQMDDLARGASALRVAAAVTPTVAQSPASGFAPVRFEGEDPAFARWPLTLDPPPPEALVTPILKIVGRESKQASRVEVPFRMIAPPGPAPMLTGSSANGAQGSAAARTEVESGGLAGSAAAGAESLWWSRDSARELRVPLGRSGATKLQDLSLGQGVSQHVLIAGKTGSGKSTLLHALITNIALWYPPDEVEFYLVDFKKGVEFKTYAANDLPHARAVAIESDREFGLSVLQRLDSELRRRGETYRARGVQDLAGYRRVTADDPSAERFPRTLLVIDEFQEFFTEDDKIGQDATLLLDRLVRQGRAFGIHIILGSQTLGGAYSLARSTIGQMAVRVALQCSESDSYLILSDDNSAARLLSRPGEAIYNDQGGLVEGNNPFQIAWLDDDHRDTYLERVRELAADRGVRRRDPLIVFEGNIPADLERNTALLDALEALEGAPAPAEGAEGGPSRGRRSGAPSATPPTPATPLRAWLGDAIAIKEPTAAVFRRQSGANLLIVGQRDDAAIGMLASATIGLLAQRPAARVHLFDGLPPDAPEAGQLAQLGDLLPGGARPVAWRDVPEVIGEIHAELLRRQRDDVGDAPPIVLAIAGLARYRMLRQEDDFGFSADADAPLATEKQFGAILREGPLVGIHTMAWVDTFNNLGRALDRQSMKEFEQRVLFQMGQSDSSSLIDSPAASRLGLHRALFFSEEAGALEKFRPYAMPERPWLERVCATIRLARAAATADEEDAGIPTSSP